MSEVPANPFAVPDGQPPDPASLPGPASDSGGSPYGQPSDIPAYGTPPPDSYDAPPPYGAPVPPSYGPPGGMYPPPYSNAYAERQGTNGLAVASMVVGIVSLVTCAWFVPAIVGLVLGIVALNQTRNQEAGGQGMAVAGVVTSAISLVAAVIILVGLIAT